MKRPPWLPPTDTSSVLFALRTTLASFVALYLAFLMNMDDPKWAAMTVWIVAQQDRGMSRSKAAYRAAGTVIGASVAVTLVALWGQNPELLLVGLAIWIACCVALATSRRNFQAYGAVLAGYTAAIIALDVARQPGEVFPIALSRTLYILLGIVCEGVAAAVLSLTEPENELRARLAALVTDASRICERALRGEPTISQSIRKLFTDALSVDTSAGYAAAVSSNASGLVRTVRYIAGAVLEQLTASQALSDHLAVSKNAQDLFDATADAFAKAADALPYGKEQRRREQFMTGLEQLLTRVHAKQDQSAFTDAVLMDRLESLIAPTQALAGIINESTHHWRGRMTRAPARFSFVVDRTTAGVNGLRAFIAISLAALIWVTSGWETGAGFVTITGVVCALFATRPNPTVGSWAFFRGAFAAALVAACCNFVLLPHGNSFVWLALAIFPFLFIGGLALRNPRTAGAAAGFTIFLLDLIGPRNDGQADPTAFFNGALTLCGGIAFGAMIFHLIAPSDPVSVRRRLHKSILRDLERLAVRPRRWSRITWLGRIADSVNRQASRTAGVSSQQIETDFRFTLAVLDIGRSTMLLARLAEDVASVHAPDARWAQRSLQRTVQTFLRRMEDVSRDPAAAARAAHRGARRLASLSRNLLSENTSGPAAARPAAQNADTAARQAAYALQRAADALDAHMVNDRS